MNLILLRHVSPSGSAHLRGDAAEHVRRILKARPGDSLRVGLLGGSLGHGVVAQIDRGGVEIEQIRLDAPPPPPLGVELFLALPRPKFLGRILQDATALGVKHIHLLQTERVEKSYWHSRTTHSEAVERHLLIGLQQARDTQLPRVDLARSWSHALQAIEARAAADLWLADGDAERPFPHAPKAPAAVMLGPEGGLRGREIRDLQHLGARGGHLGARVLRVETATTAVLSRFLPG